MELVVDRRWPKPTYTIGILYVDGVRFCETLEDTDRGLCADMSDYIIRQTKIPNETAIPKGKYNVRMDVTSPKYSAIKWYNDLCKGKMPRLERVPGFEGILIHPGGGNGPLDTAGCLLVGRNTIKGKLTSSRDTFKALYAKMKAAYDRGEKITIEIK